MADLRTNLKRQGENVFAFVDGIGHRITGGLPSDINVSSLPTFQGGRTSSDLSFAEAQNLFQSRVADQQNINNAIASQTFEERVGTVEAFRQGQLNRELDTEDKLLLDKRGFDVGDVSGLKTPEQLFREREGRFPTREEQINLGINVPTADTPGYAPPAGLSPQEARAQLEKEAENIAKYGSANPTQAQIDAAKFRQETAADILSPADVNGTTLPAGIQTSAGLSPILTPTQQRAQAQSERAQQLTGELAGKAEFTAQAQEQAGIPELESSIRDLQAQLDAEYNNLAGIRGALENAAVGRGITTELLSRKERGLINDANSKILGLSSLLSAKQGLLATAESQAQRAVDAKYNPILEELAITQSNLEILQNSPLLKAEETALAQAMQANLKSQQDLVAQEKADALYNKNLANEVALSNPGVDAKTLNAIANATDTITASQLAAPYLQKSPGLAGLSEDQLRQFNVIAGQIKTDPDIKGFIDVRDSYNRVLASSSDPSPAGDLALIFNYMKILDPGSVVREGEFANAQNSGSVPTQIQGLYNRVLSGERLTDTQRADFVDRAQRLFNEKLNSHRDAVSFYEEQADAFGLPKNLLLRDFAGDAGALPPLPELNKSYASLDDLIRENPAYLPLVEQLDREKPGITDDEILQVIESGNANKLSISGNFNQVGGDTQRLAQAIGTFESGGNYSAIGPETANGNRAYGKYQIMDFNIPNWSKEVLGRSITKEEFLQNPDLQDEVAQQKIADLYAKYGNIYDVASVWFSGRPLEGNVSQDVLGTSVPEYVKNVASIFNSLG